MKILHITLNFNSKLEYQEVALLREQKNNGHDVYVLTSDHNPNFLHYEETYEKFLGPKFIGSGFFLEDGIKIFRTKLIGKFNIFIWLKGGQKIIKKIKPDLIICHGFENGLLCLLSLWSTAPTIIDSHYMKFHEEIIKNGKLKCIIRKIVNLFKGLVLSCRANTYFVGVTEESVGFLDSYLFGKKYCHLIPLAADISSFFRNDVIRNKKRLELGISEKDFLIIYTGKVQDYKGVHLIIEAMYNLKKLGVINIKLLVVGKGPKNYLKKLELLINHYNLKDNIIFRNFVHKVSLNEFFNAADVAIYPRDITISHIEAMAVGLPIIIEDLEGAKHRLEYNNGFSIKADDVDELAEKIYILYNDKNLCKEMGKRSRELVHKKLNWSYINKQFLSLIE